VLFFIILKAPRRSNQRHFADWAFAPWTPPASEVSEIFEELVNRISDIGMRWHRDRLLAHVEANAALVDKTLRDLPVASGHKRKSAVVISAGPSVHKYNVPATLRKSGYGGSVVAVDGSMIKCLQNGLVPDYVLTLDPHPTRIVRWFGDPDFEENTRGDDYFSRQDLDVEFRKNSIQKNLEAIDLVNRHARQIRLVLCTTAPANVVARARDAGFDMYWWNPLVDDPTEPGSLTREMYEKVNAPCMNTGGTVGTAAWVFADRYLKASEIAVTGMDLGYHMETPITHTQTYYELHEHVNDPSELQDLFPRTVFPLTGEEFFTDPTYAWYRRNMLELLGQSQTPTYNCSGAGTLFGPGIELMHLADFLERHRP
jgi:hypothetical protein